MQNNTEKPSIKSWIASHILADLVSTMFWFTSYFLLRTLDRHIFSLGFTPSITLTRTTELIIPFVLSTLVFSLIFLRPLKTIFFHRRIAVAVTSALSPYIVALLVVYEDCSRLGLNGCHYLPSVKISSHSILAASPVVALLLSVILFKNLITTYMKSLAAAIALCSCLLSITFVGNIVYHLYFNVVENPELFLPGKIYYLLAMSLSVTVPCSLISLVLGYVPGAVLTSTSKETFRQRFLKIYP